MRERDLDLPVRDVVGPTEHAVRLLTFGQRRHVEALHELVDVAPVVRVDHRPDLGQHVLGVAAVDVDGLLRHHGVDAVRHPVDVLVDPVQLDLELLGTEADRAEHAEPARLAHGRDDVATVGESEDRVLDPEHVTELGAHLTLQDHRYENVCLYQSLGRRAHRSSHVQTPRARHRAADRLLQRDVVSPGRRTRLVGGQEMSLGELNCTT